MKKNRSGAPEVFQTERLLIRPPRKSDARAIFDAYASDPEVTKYLTWLAHQSVSETRLFLDGCLNRRSEGSGLTWVITLEAGRQLIGIIGAHKSGHKMEIGYALGRPFWGRGYMSEVVPTIVEW